MYNAILYIDTSNNAWHSQAHWLIGKPYLSTIASNVANMISVLTTTNLWLYSISSRWEIKTERKIRHSTASTVLELMRGCWHKFLLAKKKWRSFCLSGYKLGGKVSNPIHTLDWTFELQFLHNPKTCFEKMTIFHSYGCFLEFLPFAAEIISALHNNFGYSVTLKLIAVFKWYLQNNELLHGFQAIEITSLNGQPWFIKSSQP